MGADNRRSHVVAGAREHLNLLSCNILAGGSIARYRDYVTKSWKHVLPSRGKRSNLDRFAKLLADFDLVGLQEADAGSLRSGFVNQTQYLAEAAQFPYWSHQPNRKVARFAASANGLLTRIEPSEVRDYPLPGRIPGRGALWVRFGAGDAAFVVVIAHLSLGPAARRRQFDFLAELIAAQSRIVLMGDLNCPAHSRELSPLFKNTALVPPQEAAPPTFPSWQPRRAIDHILTSANIAVERLWTLPHPVSDHLPLAARIKLP
ncbi:MAG: endonuclease/exonuclease/phosphatase family protein [Proteobacteria bacterium]|nr:endonuclease/exonuclease/phosphatase family protein [Pseudomonadota bacterium]